MIRALLLVVGLAAAMLAQDRDTPTKEPAPSGRLRVRVLAADSARPVARAQVVVAGTGASKFGASGSTDLFGGFEVKVPEGTYLVTASKSGAFLDTQFGQVDPEVPGKVVSIVAGEERSIDVGMIRAGVIAGRVFDEAGDPLPNAAIQAMPQQSSGVIRQQSSTAGGPPTMVLFSSGGRMSIWGDVSDDRGEYRIFGLPPGEYLLVGRIRVGGSALRPAAVYFPGVTDPGSARRLQIGRGQEITGADFTIRFAPTVTVSGVAVGPDGQPLSSGTISLQVAGVDGLAGLVHIAPIRKDGTFNLEIMPGHYIVRARHPQRGAPGSTPYDGDLSLAVQLSVGEADIKGLFLKLTHGATLKGRMVFEGAAEPPALDAPFRVMVETGSPGAMAVAQPGEDGAFSIGGIESGSRRVVASAPPGWILKGVFLDGADVADVPVEFRDGVAIENVSVVFTEVKSALSITVERAPRSGSATIAVFPHDPAMWHAQSRRTEFRAVDTESIVLESLPPGDYLVVAVADVAPSSFNAADVKLLERLRPLAEHVQLIEGIGASVRLRLVPFPH